MTDCPNCQTNEHVAIEQIWQNCRGTIIVVNCRACGEFITVKSTSYVHEYLIEEVTKAWDEYVKILTEGVAH